jgi:hypothetical protein
MLTHSVLVSVWEIIHCVCSLSLWLLFLLSGNVSVLVRVSLINRLDFVDNMLVLAFGFWDAEG